MHRELRGLTVPPQRVLLDVNFSGWSEEEFDDGVYYAARMTARVAGSGQKLTTYRLVAASEYAAIEDLGEWLRFELACMYENLLYAPVEE